MTTATATAAPTSADVGTRGWPAGIVDLLGVTVTTTSFQLASMARSIQWDADFQVESSGNVPMARSIQWEAAQMAALSGRRPQPQWLQPTIRRILTLPWDDDNWNDDARPIDPAAAANLLFLLASILDDTTPTPIIVPTWRGGVQAEWHKNDVDLEIEVDPDGTIYYSFENSAEEHEGPVSEDLNELTRYVSYLRPQISADGSAR